MSGCASKCAWHVCVCACLHGCVSVGECMHCMLHECNQCLLLCMHTCTCGCTHPHHMQISRCMPTTTDSGLWRWARTPSAGRAQPENCGSSFVGRAAKDCTAHAPLIHSTVHELRALAAWSQAVYGWRQTSQVIGHVTTGLCLFLRLATQVVGHLIAQLKQAWNPDRSVNKWWVQQEYQH